MEKAKRGNFYPKRGIWLEQYCQSREGLEFLTDYYFLRGMKIKVIVIFLSEFQKITILL